ncbi:hypothetical protein RB213_000618 [Colletotrichum asianum]
MHAEQGVTMRRVAFHSPLNSRLDDECIAAKETAKILASRRLRPRQADTTDILPFASTRIEFASESDPRPHCARRPFTRFAKSLAAYSKVPDARDGPSNRLKQLCRARHHIPPPLHRIRLRVARRLCVSTAHTPLPCSRSWHSSGTVQDPASTSKHQTCVLHPSSLSFLPLGTSMSSTNHFAICLEFMPNPIPIAYEPDMPSSKASS